ncbi:hypothetical protein J3E71DRAFT_381648 [Bipolaris maydis]|nr:hypothetical protein J3E71DRAFT_381648 [Bipolaris maydis]
MPELFARFPRELTDMVLTELVLLHNDDPVYQWTRLRLLSPHLKASVEQYFREFWLPKLSFAISTYGLSDPGFVVFGPPQGKSARFEKREGDASRQYVVFEADHDPKFMTTVLRDDLVSWLHRTTRPGLWSPWDNDCQKSIIVRLGEGTLNKGFTKGGIVSNTVIPGIKINVETDPWQLSFDWKSMFTWLLTEEMLLQSFRDKLLDKFLPEIQTVKGWEARQTAIYIFLLHRYRAQRISMLAAYWDHVVRHTSSGASRSLGPPAETFDMTPYVENPKLRHPRASSLDFDTAISSLGGGQSIIFHIPGWQTWTIRQLASMRILDELTYDAEFLSKNSRADCEYYTDVLLRQSKVLKKRKDANDSVFERHLRGPALNLMWFWISCDAEATDECQMFGHAGDSLLTLASFVVLCFLIFLFERSVL